MAETKIILTAVDQTAAVIERAKNNMAGLGSAANLAGKALAGIGIALSLREMVAYAKSLNDGVDALNDVKDATGASIENISALEDVAARTGTSFDTVSTALVKFNGVLKDAKPGTDAAAAFEALGLNAKALKDLDPAEALLQTAQAMAGFADDGNKARLTQELFGKSLKEVAPFLKDLAEQQSLVAKVTAEQAQAAEDFNKQLFELQKNATDAGRALVSGLLPALSEAAIAFKAGIENSNGLVDAMVRFGLTTNPIKNTAEQLNSLRAEIAGLEDDRARYQRSNSDTRAIDDALREAQLRLNYFKTLQKFAADQSSGNQSPAEAARLGLSGKALPTIGSLPDKSKKDPKEQIDDASRSLASYVQGLQGQIDKQSELTENERALNLLKSLGTTGQVPQVRQLVLSLADQIDKEKELTETLKLKRAAASAPGDAVNADNDKYQAQLKTLLDATPSAQLERDRADIELLTKRLEDGYLSEETYLEAVSARLGLLKTDGKDAADGIAYVFTNAFKGMEDSLVEFATTGKLNFKSLADSIVSDMIRVQIQQSITKPLMGAMKDGSLVDGVKKLFGFANGGIMSSAGPLPLHAYANGGIANSPQLAVFGEGRMNEAFVPLPDGRSIPVTMQGGKSVNITQNFAFNGPADRAQVLTAAQMGAALARQQIRDDMNRGRL